MSKEKIRHEEHRDLIQCGYVEIQPGIFCNYWVVERDGGFEIDILFYNFSKETDETVQAICYDYARKRVLMGYHLT